MKIFNSGFQVTFQDQDLSGIFDDFRRIIQDFFQFFRISGIFKLWGFFYQDFLIILYQILSFFQRFLRVFEDFSGFLKDFLSGFWNFSGFSKIFEGFLGIFEDLTGFSLNFSGLLRILEGFSKFKDFSIKIFSGFFRIFQDFGFDSRKGFSQGILARDSLSRSLTAGSLTLLQE